MTAPKWNPDTGEYTYEVVDEDMTPQEIQRMEEDDFWNRDIEERNRNDRDK